MPRELIKGTGGMLLAREVFNFGAQARATQRYTGSFAACKAGAPGFGKRGAGDLAGFTVDSAIPSHEGDTENAELIINWVWDPTQLQRPPGQDGGFDMPPDKYSVRKVSEDLPIEGLHPWNKLTKDPSNPVVVVDPNTSQKYEIVSLLKQVAANPMTMWEVADRVIGTGITAEQKSLARELLQFYQTSTTHKRVWYHAYTWLSFHWFLPRLDIGGYCTGSPGGPGGSVLPVGCDWLREPDECEWDGSYWAVTSTWQGIPDGLSVGSSVGWKRNLYPHV